MNVGREESWNTLMRAARAGDRRAYGAFLTAVTPFVRAVAVQRSRSSGAPPSEVEDIVQEVLIAIHLKQDTWDGTRPIAPWIAAIVRHKLVDAFRRRGHRSDVPIDEVEHMLAADEAPENLPAVEIDGLVARLKPPQCDIVRWISLEGVSIRDTAARLGMTEGAVRTALHRAIRTLSTLYRREAR